MQLEELEEFEQLSVQSLNCAIHRFKSIQTSRVECGKDEPRFVCSLERKDGFQWWVNKYMGLIGQTMKLFLSFLFFKPKTKG